MKNAYRVSTEQHGDRKSGVLWSKNSTSCKLGVIVHSALSCSNMWNTNYPHRHVNLIALHVFEPATVKLQIFDANEPDFSALKQDSKDRPTHNLTILDDLKWPRKIVGSKSCSCVLEVNYYLSNLYQTYDSEQNRILSKNDFWYDCKKCRRPAQNLLADVTLQFVPFTVKKRRS